MISKKIIQIEEATVPNKSRLEWESFRDIRGSKSLQSIKELHKTLQDWLQNWKTYLKDLFGNPPLPSDDKAHTIISKQLPIEMGGFTLAELLSSIKSISNHKSCGPDEILTESWKTGLLSDVLLLVCNKALKGDIPMVWKRSGNHSTPKERKPQSTWKLYRDHFDVSSCQDL